MRMRIRQIHKTFIVLLISVFSLQSFAQNYSFTEYSIQDGLTHASVSTLFQDSRGLIWIGTNGGGVSHYDGYDFYSLSESDGLCGNEVKTIIEDSVGNIWLGTNTGVCVFDGKTILHADSLVEALNVTKLVMHRGNIWALCHKNVFRFFISKNRIAVEQIHIKNVPGVLNDMLFDEFNRCWLASDSGLIVLNENFEQQDLGVDYSIPRKRITSLGWTPNNEIWVGTDTLGAILLKYDSLSCYAKRSYNSYFDGIGDKISSVAIDKKDDAWLATNNGVAYIDYPFVRTLNDQNGLGTNNVTSVLEDVEGNIWIGTKGNGLKVFPGWHFIHYSTEAGLPSNKIACLAQDFRGYYWGGSDDGNVFFFRQDNDLIKVQSALLPEEYGDANVTYIEFAGSNEIYLGTNKAGVLRINNRNVERNFDEADNLPGNEVRNILFDSDSVLWIGTTTGLAKIMNDTVIDLTTTSSAFVTGVNDIIEYDEAKIIASNAGAIIYSKNKVVTINKSTGLQHNRVNSLLLDKQSNLWIGTFGGGLYIANLKDTMVHAKHFLGNDILTSNNIYSLVSLNDSVVLVGTDRGANRIELYTDTMLVKSVHSYKPENGFLNPECKTNAILKDADGKIWFGSKTGITCYDHRREKKTIEKPKLFFTDLQVNLESRQWKTNKEGLGQWFNFPASHKLKHNENELKFSYSGVYFSEELSYQYFLVGHNTKWSTEKKERFVEFSNLNPGKYTFKVRAVTKSGVTSDIKAFSFEIKPPFWQTWWFILLTIVVVVWLVIRYIKYREQKLLEAKRVLEETVEKRTEEIREQKTKIEKQKQELTDSIEYAKNIQQAMIPNPEKIKDYLCDHFIMFLPRDIVSGDFYWFGETDNKYVFTVADCTGHGVPGAFMSMLGIRLLNEIVLERKITAPDQILESLREGVITALKQEDEGSRSKDGMDMTLCVFDKEKMELQMAGAYNPLWLVRDGELIAYKADRMPVAIYIKPKDFTCNTIECKKGDKFYLTSDGFSDQFGGEKESKYKSKNMKDFILSISHLPMLEQKERLLSEFYSWKGEVEQIDDVAVMGVEI